MLLHLRCVEHIKCSNLPIIIPPLTKQSHLYVTIREHILSSAYKPSTVPASEVPTVVMAVTGQTIEAWAREVLKSPFQSTTSPTIDKTQLDNAVDAQLQLLRLHNETLLVKINELSGYPMLVNFYQGFAQLSPKDLFVQLQVKVTNNKGPNYTSDCALVIVEVTTISVLC